MFGEVKHHRKLYYWLLMRGCGQVIIQVACDTIGYLVFG